MKLVRTSILFDKGDVARTTGWKNVHSSVEQAVAAVDFPEGSGKLTLRKRTRHASGQWNRNGVKYLKNRFLKHIVEEGWTSESPCRIPEQELATKVMLYPELAEYEEQVTSKFGNFDFCTTTPDGLNVAIEWETGNVSSSHRSLNKLVISLRAGTIQIGLMLVPTRALYKALTDRIGNIAELSGYLRMWQSLATGVDRGLLALVIIEHDALTNDHTHPYLPSGKDGRSAQGAARRRSSKKP